jgi:hypothetical protein
MTKQGRQRGYEGQENKEREGGWEGGREGGTQGKSIPVPNAVLPNNPTCSTCLLKIIRKRNSDEKKGSESHVAWRREGQGRENREKTFGLVLLLYF